MSPLDMSPIFEKRMYLVLDGPIDELDEALNRAAKEGYYPASAPQVYQHLHVLTVEMFVMVILELDEDRLKLEGRRA